ncbi:protein MpRLK-Pelle_PERK-1 [Marchantia polymorpha subsp. ruderalis]|nr:hypothetical protein Mp_2g07270 [Marchantia polymorpha subsp. ruderalis]
MAATPPTTGAPTGAPPPAISPPAPPPATAPPPADSPPPPSPVAPPPEATSPPPPVAVPPVFSPPPPVEVPPPVVSPPPPAALPPASSPPPPVAVPPTESPPPPAGTPPAPEPVGSTPPVTNTPPPTSNPSPPPPTASPPPPGTPPAPPPSPPPPAPPVTPTPPGVSASPPPPPRPIASPPPPKAPTTTTPPSSDTSSSGGISTTAVVGIAVGGVIALILIGALWICLARRRPKQKLNYAHRVGHNAMGGMGSNKSEASSYGMTGSRVDYLDSGEMTPKPTPPPPYKGDGGGMNGGAPGAGKMVPPPPQGSPSAGSTRPWFTYDELEVATNGFSRDNLLGEGGFGRVYKGVVAGNQLVAVKQLTIGGGQGEREFRAEVEIISRVHHRHLVSLVGYCIADSQRLLVYDFVPNGTLEHALHGKNMPVIDWPTRMKIALGSARGLGYLHEDCHPKIIHRDIKASNILLDNSFEAQVADFGLAKLANEAHTHVTTRVMGTFGYLAPEYALSGKLTDKSDVYSFGVVLLELITGKKPVDVTQAPGEESLVEWSRPMLTQALEDGNLDVIADPALQNNFNEKEMFRMVEVAAACVRHSANRRPKMGQVVRALETEGADLNQGVKPGYSTVYSVSSESGEYDSSQYKANLKQFRKMALQGTTGEYGSEYGMTNEYGVAQSASSSEYQFDSRDHGPPPRGQQQQQYQGQGQGQQAHREQQIYAHDSDSSRSSDDTRIEVLDEPSPRPGMRAQGHAQVGALPLPPNRRTVAGGGLRGGSSEDLRSKSPTNQRPGHRRRGSGSASGAGGGARMSSVASSVFSQDYTPQPPPPPPDYGRQYSEEYPESKYSTEDEGKPSIIADRLEEGR